MLQPQLFSNILCKGLGMRNICRWLRSRQFEAFRLQRTHAHNVFSDVLHRRGHAIAAARAVLSRLPSRRTGHYTSSFNDAYAKPQSLSSSHLWLLPLRVRCTPKTHYCCVFAALAPLAAVRLARLRMSRLGQQQGAALTAAAAGG
jgi:hypothetical protein